MCVYGYRHAKFYARQRCHYQKDLPRYNEFSFLRPLFIFFLFFLVFLLFAALKVFCKISILVCRYASQHPSSCELINQNVCANKSPKNASKKNLVEIRPNPSDCQSASQRVATIWVDYSTSITAQSIKFAQSESIIQQPVACQDIQAIKQT